MFNMYSEFTLDKKACTLQDKSIANVPKLESIKKKDEKSGKWDSNPRPTDNYKFCRIAIGCSNQN